MYVELRTIVLLIHDYYRTHILPNLESYCYAAGLHVVDVKYGTCSAKV